MFTEAKRTQSKLRLALFGPSGAGKTLSSLILAASVGKACAERRGEKGFGKVCVIDTENGRASMYAGHSTLPKGFKFDRAVIKAPFHPKNYIKLIEEAARQKYDVVIVDSLSHAWSGKGGMLDIKDQSGEGFQGWRKVSQFHARLVDSLLQTNIHLIATCRSKTEYAMVDDPNKKGRKQVRKLGLAPVFRDGLEYEFMVVWELDMDHLATPSKDNTSLFDTPEGKIVETIGTFHGERLFHWLHEQEDEEEDSEAEEDDAEEEEESEETDDTPARTTAGAEEEEEDDLFG